MSALTFYAHDKATKRAWKFDCSLRWYERNDNGVAVSCGFALGEHITEAQLRALGAVAVDYEEYQHSGCQSSCVKRGGATCRW